MATVVITTERLKNPQQLNVYAYVANTPLRFIDPTGEILTLTGAKGRLAAGSRLTVTFDTTGPDLSKNAGATLGNGPSPEFTAGFHERRRRPGGLI